MYMYGIDGRSSLARKTGQFKIWSGCCDTATRGLYELRKG